MKILIDGDGCPVVDITVSVSQNYGVECLILCDTAHEIHRDGAQTLTFDKGADSVDFALANRVRAGDLVITQDYGLASMCLARGARVLHQDGWEYTQWNIDALLLERHAAKKFRMSGGKTKAISKRTEAQNQAFRRTLESCLSQSNKSQG